ncbi:hypothetical protein A3A71_02640 [Candidatus Berkelbacteria bacterium RIFCSPLOWO2_01_FULL_50_28]|uniref:Uncharacterized protein n=1 Tax=Candidatus Berkelbacteria bacterium RIFCSPLOWO2_01_FULL_50_28 TaxID=1797471 RepID=A0A1F5EBX9_9BACT|nr:MAG: hypothetical protein A2807_02130 [Candidatus Berkelbacteria bacterium RIFCSPHIGHO2_01_FULL_50_36]OGD62606.1 MAG: hypothetical protein A3F39_02715 [Candidatus Berkelbacteria bacterium RIFCSPHIGHO2_12_FULL_50_11]OGD64919.1 MAG: hypothetical protein A3A71_02640 [Candidatus Berkelbacteria bacterium RIFCSPLOWO2_01_FULL_50_28]
MSYNNQQMVLKTIDTTSQRLKAGNLEVLAWLEYWMLYPRESRLYSESVSMQFMKYLRGFTEELGISSLINDRQIIVAATLLDEPIIDGTWGAVDIVEKDSFYLVAVFNNGGLTDFESNQLIAALSRMRVVLELNDLVYWSSWGKYSSVRAEFEKYHRKQLRR